jgi:hypothetical protein
MLLASNWDQIIPFLERYPSPHNSQPIKIHADGDTLSLFYDLDLGLPAESYGIAFGSVCAGVFIESAVIAAHHFGYEVDESLAFGQMDFTAVDRLFPLGKLHLRTAPTPVEDISADLLIKRRTSRMPYERRQVPDEIIAKLSAEATRHKHTLNVTADARLVHEVIQINQRTLFYDLDNPKVRKEIQGYLRYNDREARSRSDGLSAECLALPGALMRLFMGNHWIWGIPVLGGFARRVYLNSMDGVTQIGWLTGPFESVEDYTRAGRLFIRLWLMLTAEGVYLHPFGSVITNPKAHKEFIAAVKSGEGSNMAWMLFRLGYSRTPPESYRRHDLSIDNA